MKVKEKRHRECTSFSSTDHGCDVKDYHKDYHTFSLVKIKLRKE